MAWVDNFFIKQAHLYAMVLDALWQRGQQGAEPIANYLKQNDIKDGRILDIPCGIGRIAIPLAQSGYTVTGIDISPAYIKIAKERAKQNQVTNKTWFIQGKMQQVDKLLRKEKPYDVALNVFTSLGYGTQQEDQEFFKGLRRVIRKSGLFMILALGNRDYIITHFQQNLYDETEKLVILHRNELDITHSRLKSNWKFYLKKRNDLKFVGEAPIELRLYSPHEITTMLEKTGWKVREIFDTLTDRRSFTAQTTHFTVIAQAI